MQKKVVDWEWIPFISIGIIRIGESIETIIPVLRLNKLDKPFDEADWDSYEFLDYNKRVYTEDNIVTSIGCFDSLYYNGKDLFGLSLDEIVVILGDNYDIGEVILFDFEDDKFEEIPIRFNEYGLQIWIKDGLVESAIIRGKFDE